LAALKASNPAVIFVLEYATAIMAPSLATLIGQLIDCRAAGYWKLVMAVTITGIIHCSNHFKFS